MGIRHLGTFRKAPRTGLLLAAAAGSAACAGLAIPAPARVSLTALGSYASGVFGAGAAEIPAHDPSTQRLFVVNANDVRVDVLDVRDPMRPRKVGALEARSLGGSANSVAVARGLVAVAIEAERKQEDGVVALYEAASLLLRAVVPVGALPDCVAFTPDGRWLVVANEGEPDAAYRVDPEGSVSLIDLRGGVERPRVATADFRAFDARGDELRAAGVRLFGPGATVSQDLEPEFVTTLPDSRRAWVTLQENNALAEVDVHEARVTRIVPLAFKDHRLAGNALDPSDRDGGIRIRSWPVYGMYQPDAIANYRFRGETLLVTANEGDTRDYAGFREEARVQDLVLDPQVFPAAETLQHPENLGRLKVTRALGSADGAVFQRLFAFGARSFSIWTLRGEQVFDSGSGFESATAFALPDAFNADHADNDSFDSRSDDRGPEPEGVVLGRIAGRTYAFVGLERVGGILVYDVTDPRDVGFRSYVNRRNFAVDACWKADAGGACRTGPGSANPEALDLGPEGLIFVPAHQSPIGAPLLVVANEVSGTTTLYRVDVR